MQLYIVRPKLAMQHDSHGEGREKDECDESDPERPSDDGGGGRHDGEEEEKPEGVEDAEKAEKAEGRKKGKKEGKEKGAKENTLQRKTRYKGKHVTKENTLHIRHPLRASQAVTVNSKGPEFQQSNSGPSRVNFTTN